MNHTLAATAAAIIGIHAVCGPAAAQRIPRYRIEVIAPVQPNPPAGMMSETADMSPDRSTIVGFVDRPGGVRSAYVWRDGVLEDLPTVPGYTMTVASGVNSAGDIVGTASVLGVGYDRPLLWSGGRLSVLPALSGVKGMAADINESGQIVGASEAGPGGRWRATLWENGVPSALALPPGCDFGMAHSISDSGLVFGFSAGPAAPVRPTIWGNGSVTTLPLLEGAESFSLGGINDAGLAVGVSVSQFDGIRAVLWSGGVAIELPGLGGVSGQSFAGDINNAGDIVGISDGPNGHTPVIWRNGEVFDLLEYIDPLPGVWVNSAGRITDDGVILGSASVDGCQVGIRLVPVPAPATAFVGAAVAMLAAARRGRPRR